MNKILGLLLISTLFFLSCEEASKTTTPLMPENKVVTDIKHKIIEFKKAPARVEVRNYLKSADHKYQKNIMLIKKIKTPLDPKSEVYLEINLFTNEEDPSAPLVAQFMWFNIKSKSLILEENLNLE
jgi:hypothetical protein